jgi:hypothetical protein
MKRLNYRFYVRKAHRYLGFFIGIQFILWTLGGLFFSWTRIDEVRGEHLESAHHAFGKLSNLVSPTIVIDQVRGQKSDAAITRVELIEVLGEPFYAIDYHLADKTEGTVVASAADGTIRPQITADEAEKIAVHALKVAPDVKSVEYVTADVVGKHHEYREKPLPAWAVTFEGDFTVYLSANTGKTSAIRTNEWRVFDFLWMFHTMDFQQRDNINNYLLRAFSALGLVTIASGFALFFSSSRFWRGLFSGGWRS